MTFPSLELGYLTPEMVEKAKTELGETEEIRKKAIAELRNLLKEEKDLVCAQTDEYLQQFLRARKYNVKRAFNLMTNYYNTKKQRPEVYSPDFMGFRNSVENQSIWILPQRDKDGTVILILRLECWDYNERKMSSIVHDITVVIMLLLEDPATQVCGVKVIFDMNTLSLGHVKAIKPKYLRLIASGVNSCLPLRVKSVDVVNGNVFLPFIWNIVKFFLSDKIINRIYFHTSDMSTVHKHISPEILPVEYGGQNIYDAKRTLKLIDSLRGVYDELMSYGYTS